MKRLAAVIASATIGAALLLPGKMSFAVTTYTMYFQPVSPLDVTPGPDAVFQFRALVDIPAFAPGKTNGTLALTVGPTITYDPAVTGSTTGTPNSRKAFQFQPDPFWSYKMPATFSFATDGTLTYQGNAALAKTKDPVTKKYVMVPGGTYTIGTFSIPVRYPGPLYLHMTTPFGLTGPDSVKEYVYALTSDGTRLSDPDGVGVFPDDGMTHFTHFTVNANSTYARLSGNITLKGVTVSGSLPASRLPALTIQLRTPGTTNVVATLPPVTLAYGVYMNAAFKYSTVNTLSGTFDVAYNVNGHLTQVVHNVTMNGATQMPDVFLAAGDANGDNSVDMADFGLVVNAYSGDAAVAGSGYDARADFNYDGVVDLADFGILINEYGNVGAP